MRDRPEDGTPATPGVRRRHLSLQTAEPAGGAQPGEATEPYAVGYGKPPASTQFKKGRSGNPKGRPAGARNTMTIVREILDREVTVRGGDGQRRITGREANFTALLQKALKGDVRALKLVHDIAVQLDEDLARDASLDPGQAETPAPLSDEDDAVLTAFEHEVLRRHGLDSTQAGEDESPLDANIQETTRRS